MFSIRHTLFWTLILLILLVVGTSEKLPGDLTFLRINEAQAVCTIVGGNCTCDFLNKYFGDYTWAAQQIASQESACSPSADNGFAAGLFQITYWDNVSNPGNPVTWCGKTYGWGGYEATLSSDIPTCQQELKNPDTNAIVAASRSGGGAYWCPTWSGASACGVCDPAPNPNFCPVSKIQGTKVNEASGTTSLELNQRVWLDFGSPQTIDNPYSLNTTGAGTHTTRVEVPAYWTVRFSLCNSDDPECGAPGDPQGYHPPCAGFGCSNLIFVPVTDREDARFPGIASVTVDVPDGGFVDVWWHFIPIPAGGAEPLPTPTEAINKVESLKIVMKSLLDGGVCPVEPGPGPGPGGPIPTPCPPESNGAAALMNYISNTFNIHFQGAWKAGGLYDVCQKLYETSGTRFDDFFVNDLDGATIATNGGGGFCSVFGKNVSCDPSMLLIGSRGEIFTFTIFHELAHTLKALNPAAAREDDIGPIARFEYNLHLGETTTPWLFDETRHISKYPYGLHNGTCSIASTWPVEEYAETVAHYFHRGTGEIMLAAGACSGGAAFRPYVNSSHKAPEHCNFMDDVVGAYNLSCAETLGIWQAHSNACDAADLGSCQASTMLQFFDTHAVDAVQICRVESGGNPLALNDNCLTATTADYSVGLMQINLLGLCPLGITWTNDFSNPQCTIINQAELDKCKEKYGYGNPLLNVDWAKKKSEGRIAFSGPDARWQPWSGSASACGLYPHP